MPLEEDRVGVPRAALGVKLTGLMRAGEPSSGSMLRLSISPTITNTHHAPEISPFLTMSAGPDPIHNDATGSSARFSQPEGITVTTNGALIYVADTWTNTIRQITSAGVVTTLIVSGPITPSWKHGGYSVRGTRGPRDTYG